MSCHDIQNKLNDYLDEELSEQQNRQVEMHLADCPECRAELSDLKATLTLAGSLDEIEPPPFYAERIMANIRESSVKRPFLKRLFLFPVRIPAGVLAAVTVLFFSSSIYFFQMPGESLSTSSHSDEAPILQPKTIFSQNPLSTLSDGVVSKNSDNLVSTTSDNLAVRQSLQNTTAFSSPDMSLTLHVKEINPAANIILSELLGWQSQITGITSKKGEYRIIAEIDTGNKQDLLRVLQQTGKNLRVDSDSVAPSKKFTSKIVLKQIAE